jgi:hypothetical protein
MTPPPDEPDAMPIDPNQPRTNEAPGMTPGMLTKGGTKVQLGEGNAINKSTSTTSSTTPSTTTEENEPSSSEASSLVKEEGEGETSFDESKEEGKGETSYDESKKK